MEDDRLILRYEVSSPFSSTLCFLFSSSAPLLLLCGVDVLVASSSPKLNTVEYWLAKDTPEFHRIRERYLYFWKKQSGDEENGNPSMPSPSFPVPSLFYEKMASMEIKLKEVRERLLFLNAPSNKEELECQPQEEEWLQSHFMTFIPSQSDFHSQQDLLTDFCTPLQQDLLYPTELGAYNGRLLYEALMAVCASKKCSIAWRRDKFWSLTKHLGQLDCLTNAKAIP